MASHTSVRKTASVTAVGLLAGLALAVLYFRLDPAHHPFPRCPVNWLTGLHCPGCGTQRALHALLHGRLQVAAGYNLLAALCAPIVLFGAVQEISSSLLGTPRRLTVLYRPWFGWAVVAATVLFTLLRNLPGPLHAWLAP